MTGTHERGRDKSPQLTPQQAAWLHNDYEKASWQTIHFPNPNRNRRLKQTIWLWIVVLIFLIGAVISVYGQELPNAPGFSPSITAVRIQKPQLFFHDRTNRALVIAQFSVRAMDAVTTRQFMTDPCNCFRELGHVAFTRISLEPVAETTGGMFAYSLGMATVETYASKKLWDRGKRSRHKNLWHLASRGVLAWDTAQIAVTGPVQNWRLLAKKH